MLHARLVWLVLACMLAAVGCRSEADGHYFARGQLRELTGTGEDARAVIHHERITNFKDRDGLAATMPSMAMSFALAPGLDLRAPPPGAKLAFEFDVRWNSDSPLVISRLSVLPSGTRLVLHSE